MGPISFIVTFFMIWWTCIFCILPFGLQRDEDGTPKDPKIKKKLLQTTLLAFVLTGIVYACIELNIVDFREIAAAWSNQDFGS